MTGAWVIVSPDRGQRPGHRANRATEADPPAFDPACPFCPGNEDMLTPLIHETPMAESPGWRTRVVENKFPALRPELRLSANEQGPSSVLPGYGFHEVIIETACHNGDLATLPDPDLHSVIAINQKRFIALAEKPRIKAVFAFRNYGRAAGASLAHPHSQLIATAVVPPRLDAASAWAESIYMETGACPVCAALTREGEDGARIVETTDNYVLLVPYAASRPFEQVIVPCRHSASFADATDGEIVALGPLLQRALLRLKAACGDPDYNFVIESGPVCERDSPGQHWRLRIAPDLTTPGGFELGAGMAINASLPERDAETLRGAL